MGRERWATPGDQQLFVSSRHDEHERRVELFKNLAIGVRHRPCELANVVRDPIEMIVVLSLIVITASG